ncbi:MAG: hypothetical protein OFPII_13840 [Osedax symbiont Rs1]|nr:MAG: hypothetical protein OFPII_13840 [Osedax symbiont Rs1]
MLTVRLNFNMIDYTQSTKLLMALSFGSLAHFRSADLRASSTFFAEGLVLIDI